jgi:hypothetical protein
VINTINTVLLPKRADAINTLIGRVATVSGWANSALEGGDLHDFQICGLLKFVST